MKKNVRLMMLSLVAMVFGAASAQTEVTLNFDEDYQTLFPTIPGVSCQANADEGIEASNAGDFTGVTTSEAVQGVTVTVAPAEDAKTPSRIWGSSPRLRMYSGSFTVSGKDITKIVFNAGSNFNLSTSTGTLNGKTWSGKADEVVFDVAKNTQLKSIVVTLGGESGGDDPDPETPPTNLTGEGTLESPFTAADATAVAGALEQGVITDASYYIKGKVSGITFTFDVDHGTATFYISEDGSENDQFLVYATYYLGNRSWKDGDTQIAVGDEVIVYGQLTNYKGTPETASKKSYIYSLNGVTDGGDTPDPDPQVKTATVAEALAIIDALEDGKKTSDEYIVKGYVVGTPEFQRKDDGSLYGNVNFAMADEKGGAVTLTVFRAKSFENEAFTEETISILKEGDLVEVQGLLQKYVKDGETTPELTTCHLVSVNGESGNVIPQPEVKTTTVAEALAIIDALEDGKKTSDEYIVKGYVVGTPEFQRKDDGSLYGNVNFAMADEKGGAVTLTVFRAKSFDNEAFTEESISILKEGDLVEVQGLLQKYVKDGETTPEISSCHLVSINGLSGDAAVNSITIDKAEGQIYNLAGQRVETSNFKVQSSKLNKGLYIQNGRKFIVK